MACRWRDPGASYSWLASTKPFRVTSVSATRTPSVRVPLAPRRSIKDAGAGTGRFVDAASEGVIFEIDSSATPRQGNARQPLLEVPRVRRRSRRIHHRLRVPVVIECHHFGVADLLSLVTLSIALSACALMPSISYILPLESVYAGPSTFVARRLANWYYSARFRTVPFGCLNAPQHFF